MLETYVFDRTRSRGSTDAQRNRSTLGGVGVLWSPTFRDPISAFALTWPARLDRHASLILPPPPLQSLPRRSPRRPPLQASPPPAPEPLTWVIISSRVTVTSITPSG